MGIIGESGSGKSTLARMLVGLEMPTEGTVELDGISISTLLARRATRDGPRRNVQFVGQDTSSSFDPLLTIRASLRQPGMNLLGLSRATADDLVDETVTALERWSWIQRWSRGGRIRCPAVSGSGSRWRVG